MAEWAAEGPGLGGKLLVVAAGFVVASAIPLVLGVELGPSLFIGAVYGAVMLLACLLPFGGTVTVTGLAVVLMIVFVPRDRSSTDLPMRGWEFAWVPTAGATVVIVAWYWIVRLRHHIRTRTRR